MAQTPQPDETGGAGDTAAAGARGPQGLFGSSTTILLILFAVAVFWWSRRRRVEMEEQTRAQRREAEAAAERSALDVAHLMRAAPQPGAVDAADRQGLASATKMPSPRASDPSGGGKHDAQAALPEDAPGLGQDSVPGDQVEARVREIERAEARATAERAAEEQAAAAARDAQSSGESLMRRMAAASSAAEEAVADTADAAQAGRIVAVPAGAVAGNGTADCPPEYPIKGNRQSRIYHRPGQVSYPSTVAEYCFASEEAAEAAGFRESRSRGQRTQL